MCLDTISQRDGHTDIQTDRQTCHIKIMLCRRAIKNCNQHFTTTNSIDRDEATIQASRIVTLSQSKFHPLSRCHVTASVNIRCCVTVGGEQSFLPLSHEEDKLIHPRKKSKQAITYASTTKMFSCPCGLRGCKNGPAPFPGRMSYKATKPGSVCPVS